MNINVLLLSNVLIYLYIAVLVAVRKLPPGRPRSALAAATGAVLGFLFGIAVARVFLDSWSAVVWLAGVLLAANTGAVSLIFTNPAKVEKMRAAAERTNPPAGRLRWAQRPPRLLRGWYRLPARWKLAEAFSAAWLVISVAITLNTTSAGDPLPAPFRALDALLTLGAWITTAAVTVKAWRLGRSAEQVEANPLP